MTRARDVANVLTAANVLSTDAEAAALIIASVPLQSGNSGKYLKTNGSTTNWDTVNQYALPSQTGNAGKFLGTDGTNESWSTVISGSAFTPVVEGTLLTAGATISGSFPAGDYEIKSSYPMTINIGGTSTTASTNYAPSRLTVPSTASTITVASTGYGNNWEQPSSGHANGNSDMVYGDRFVATTTNTTNNIIYSTDGVDWTNLTVPSSTSGYRTISYGNSLYVVWANSGGGNATTYATSSNGTTWTHRTLSATGVNSMSASAFGNGTFIAIVSGTSVAVSSTNGTTWTVRSMPASQNWTSAAYGNGTFFAHSNGTTNTATSSNGITWTARTSPEAFQKVTFANGLFVATSYAVNTNVYTSSDGITWTARTLPFNGTNAGAKRVFGGGNIFVVYVQNSGLIATSPDGNTWTQRSGGTQNWTSGAYGANNYVIMSSGNNARQYSKHINSSFGIYKPPTTTY
jgi:hypothetical protein